MTVNQKLFNVNAYSPFNDAPPNAQEMEYLEILREHHYNFTRIAKHLIKDYCINTVLELGCYLSNVAVNLRPFVGEYVATDVDTGTARPNYNEWAGSHKIKTGYCCFSRNGLSVNTAQKFDAIIASEVLEHLPYNPITVAKSFKEYLNPKGLVIISVPNRISAAKIARFVRGRHPYIFFHEFASTNIITANYGHHWLEYSLSDIKYVFEMAGFKAVYEKKMNIDFGGKFSINIKKLITLVTFGKVADQLYVAFIQKE